MSLAVPPWYFNYFISSFGNPTTSGLSSAVTAGASNADGSAVNMLTTATSNEITRDVHYLVIGMSGFGATNADCQVLLTVLSRPTGGSYATLIDSLVCGYTSPANNAGGVPQFYHFPIWIPANTEIQVVARTARTSTITGRVGIWAFGEPSRPEMWWCGTKVESLGINASTSKGTDVATVASGTGSWVDIGSVTSARYGALQFGANGTDGTAATVTYYFQIGHNDGGSTAPLRGVPPIIRLITSTEVGMSAGQFTPMQCNVPAGSQLAVRARSSASSETVNVAIYGVM